MSRTLIHTFLVLFIGSFFWIAPASAQQYGIHGTSFPGISRSGGVAMRRPRVQGFGKSQLRGAGFYAGGTTHERLMRSLDRYESRLVRGSVNKTRQSSESESKSQSAQQAPKAKAWPQKNTPANSQRITAKASTQSQPWWLRGQTTTATKRQEGKRTKALVRKVVEARYSADVSRRRP